MDWETKSRQSYSNTFKISMPIQKRWLKHFSWHNFLRRYVKSWPCQTKLTSRNLQKKRTESWKCPGFQVPHK